MRLATFTAQGNDHLGLVLTHPATGADWVFSPRRTAACLDEYASRPTSYLHRTPPRLAPEGGWPGEMVGLLAHGEAGLSAMRRLEDFLRRFLEQADTYLMRQAGWPLAEVKLRAPVPRPRLLFGLVQNSPTAWRNDMQRRHVNLLPQGHQRPLGSVLGPGDPVIVPASENPTGGWNPELGVIIGTGGRDIPVSEAMKHVAGLTVVCDLVIDNFRREVFAQPEPYDWFEDAMSSWGDKKSDTRCPVGPYLVTLDEIGNPYDLMVYTRQSGWLRDRSHTGAMSLGIERAISWLSSFRALRPGDIIHMATMGYDGMPFISALPMGPDDCLECEIEKVGVLRNPVVFLGEADWRDPEDISRRVHPVPAARDLIAAERTEIARPADWTPDAAPHFWTVFGSHTGSDLAQRPYPRFLNAPATALAGDGQAIILPPRATTLHVGVELACVIGRLTREVSVEAAAAHILGYVVLAAVQDQSIGEEVIAPATPQERHAPQMYARWGDGTNVASLPPVALAGEDWRGRACTIAVDGIGAAQGSTDAYRFSAPEVVSFMARGITLFPGDVVTLGRLGDLLTIPADHALPSGTAGHAEIAGVGRVEFTFDDRRR